MANNQKEYRILINGIEESYKNIESLGKALDDLDKKVQSVNSNGGASIGDPAQTEALAKATEKLAQAQSASAQELATLKMATQQANQEAKLQAQLANAAEGSYNQLSAQYSLTKMQLNAMSEEERRGTEEGRNLEKTAKELHDRMKDLQESTGNAALNVGNYTESINKANIGTVNMKEAIKEAREEMAQLAIDGQKNSDRYKELAQKAGEYKDALGDANDEIAHFASDTQGLDNVINLATTGINVFQTYQGVMAMVGLGTEEYEETMQQLAGAMSTLNGIQGIYNTLQDKSTAIGGAYGKIVTWLIGEKTKETVATQAGTVAQTELSVAQKVGAVASRALGIAMKTIPLMLIIGLVAELVLNWQDIVGWFTKTFPIVGKLGGVFNTLIAILKGVGAAIVHWVTNPIKTMADVIAKVLKGDFEGAWKAAVDGVKNQFTGIPKAFKDSMNQSVNIYSENQKKLAEKQKKGHKERQKNAKNHQNKLTETHKQGLKDRNEASEDAAKAEENRIQDLEKLRDDSLKKYKDLTSQELSIDQDARVKRAKWEVEKWSVGPLENYIKALYRLQMVQEQISAENKNSDDNKLRDTYADKFFNIEKLKGTGEKAKTLLFNILEENGDEFIDKIEEVREDLDKNLEDGTKNTFDVLGTTIDRESAIVLRNALKEQEIIDKKYAAQNAQLYDDFQKSRIEAYEKLRKEKIGTFEDTYKDVLKETEDFHKDLEKGANSNKTWGMPSKKNAEKAYEPIKEKWAQLAKDGQGILGKLKIYWDTYLKFVSDLYGKESTQYKKAKEEEANAFEEFQKKVGQSTSGSTATTDSNAGRKKLTDNDYGYSSLAKVAGAIDNLNEEVLQPMANTLGTYWDMVLDEISDKLDEVSDLYDKATEKVEESEDRISQIQDNMKDGSKGQTDALKQQLADEQLLYAQRAAKEQQLQNEKEALEAKQKKAEKEQRKNDMRANIAQAIANTAMGATKTLAEWSYPLGIIFAAIQTAFGLAQVGIMTSQLAKMANGGIMKFAGGGVVSGPSHAQGGVPVGNTGIEVEGGEFVINKRSTAKYFDLLNAINAQGNGGKKVTADGQLRKYANGGELNYQQIDSSMRANNQGAQMMNALSNLNFQPVVQVVDIEKGMSNLTRVRSLAGKQ